MIFLYIMPPVPVFAGSATVAGGFFWVAEHGHGGDLALRGPAGEEHGHAMLHLLERQACITQLEEDAVEREREKIRAQQVVVVDGGAPRLAHAAVCGEAPRMEAAEDIQEHVFR